MFFLCHPLRILTTGENVEGLFHRIAVVTFEDAIVKEIDSLQKAEAESKNKVMAQAGKNSLVRELLT